MLYVYRYLIQTLWIAWAIYWWVRSANVKTTSRNESIASRLGHLTPLALAIALLVIDRLPIPYIYRRYLPDAVWPFWIGCVLTAAGLLFTVWARWHLGRNWSGTVTIKHDHTLVRSGPYAIVRHPIYTGLLLAFVGTALARADTRGLIAVALATYSFVRKLRIEENWMREQFGQDYADYAQRVRGLIPFVY